MLHSQIEETEELQAVLRVSTFVFSFYFFSEHKAILFLDVMTTIEINQFYKLINVLSLTYLTRASKREERQQVFASIKEADLFLIDDS